MYSALIRSEDGNGQRGAWHDVRMVTLIKIVAQLLADVAQFAVLQFRSTLSVEAENLFLRWQLDLFKERGIKPRRADAVTRISLAVLARLFNWRDALFVVQPKTIIRWHRAGWRLFWRWKYHPGRPRIPVELASEKGRFDVSASS